MLITLSHGLEYETIDSSEDYELAHQTRHIASAVSGLVTSVPPNGVVASPSLSTRKAYGLNNAEACIETSTRTITRLETSEFCIS